MSSIQSLQVAVDIAARRRDAARMALVDACGQRDAAQAQMAQLDAYTLEIQGRWGARPSATLQPEVMLHYRHFMDRLAYAMGLQAEVVREHAGRIEACRKTLLDAELRLASLRKVCESRQAEQALCQLRRDQKQTDEMAALRTMSAARQASAGYQE